MKEQLTRREMIKLGSTLAAGAMLAACTPTPAPEPSPQPTPRPTNSPVPPAPEHVVVMAPRGEMTEDHVAAFAAEHGGDAEIEVVDWDLTRFFALYAAGNPPDLLRLDARDLSQYLARGMLYDLTPYFDASSVLAAGDLASINDYFRASGPLQVGEGPRYGVCLGWSPAFTLFANGKAFADAGADLPDEATPLTYGEILDLARLLAGGGAAFGYGYRSDLIEAIWENMLAETGESLYTDDLMMTIALVDNEAAREVVEFTYTLAAENLAPNPLNPGSGSIGDDFRQGDAALVQLGYWFAAEAESDVTEGEVTMLPAPTWSGVRRDPAVTLPGMVMSDATGVPDAAWVVFEWFLGGEPARERAQSGYGVPALESLYGRLPGETPFQQQVQRVLAGEVALDTGLLPFNPFFGEENVAAAWNTHLERSLNGEITFDEMLEDIESEVNTAIQARSDGV